MTNSSSWTSGYTSVTAPLQFPASPFFYSAFVNAASFSCLRRAEQRLIQHYQVRPAAKWTRWGVKSLLASVCNASACLHSTGPAAAPFLSSLSLTIPPKSSLYRRCGGCEALLFVLIVPLLRYQVSLFHHKLSVDGI